MDFESTVEAAEFCHAWQDDNLKIVQKLNHRQSKKLDGGDHPDFLVKFKVEFRYPHVLPLDDEGIGDDFLLVQFDLASTISYHQFCINYKNLSWGEVSRVLTKIRIPLHKQPLMLHKISNCAEEISNADKNKGLKMLPMMVSIGIEADYFCYGQQDSSTLVMKELPNVAKLKAIPASEISIESLIVVRDEEKGFILMNKCRICLKKLVEFGYEVMGMPCSHYYHRDCLLHWLKIANFCPFCSFFLVD